MVDEKEKQKCKDYGKMSRICRTVWKNMPWECNACKGKRWNSVIRNMSVAETLTTRPCKLNRSLIGSLGAPKYCCEVLQNMQITVIKSF